MSKRNERNLDDYETQRNFVCHAENQLSMKNSNSYRRL